MRWFKLATKPISHALAAFEAISASLRCARLNSLWRECKSQPLVDLTLGVMLLLYAATRVSKPE